VRKYTGQTQHADVGLSYTNNKYEMFAFGASSIVAPVGAVANTAMPGVFSGDVNLRLDLPSRSAFNALNTGHSAQFIHSYGKVGAYWSQLVGDIE
jgi:hypothetical protein